MQVRNSSVLCLHQGSELYGSDRSFLAALQVLAEAGERLDVILPGDGELAAEVRKLDSANLSFYTKGILRKRELKQPLFFVLNLFVGFLFYLQCFRKHSVIYINTVVMFSALLAACAYRFSSRRVICHVREIPTGWQLWVFRTLLLLSGAELVFNSNATQAAFGLPGKVIYNGVEQASRLEARTYVESSGSSGVLHLLLIGRINEWKGQFFLVQALARLPVGTCNRLKVRIVGSPFEGYEYLTSELEAKVAAAGLADVVELIPFCQDPSTHYSWSDYVLVASTQPEPFGRVAIEAFSYGKPVIAAGHGGLVEIVEDGSSGFLFAPADEGALAAQLAKLSSISSERYAELSRNARERFEANFSIDGYRASLRSLFAV